MNREEATNGSYNPERFARGAVQHQDNDKAGKGSKQQVFGIRLETKDGFVSLPYGFLRGLPWMNKDKTRVEIPIEGYHRHDGTWTLGEWLVTVTGKRLGSMFDYLNGAKQEWIQPAQEERQEYPEVDGVVIEPLGV